MRLLSNKFLHPNNQNSRLVLRILELQEKPVGFANIACQFWQKSQLCFSTREGKIPDLSGKQTYNNISQFWEAKSSNFEEIQAPKIAKKNFLTLEKTKSYNFSQIWEAKNSIFDEIQAPKIEEIFIFDICKDQKLQFHPNLRGQKFDFWWNSSSKNCKNLYFWHL